jgi:hypothetical protein
VPGVDTPTPRRVDRRQVSCRSDKKE